MDTDTTLLDWMISAGARVCHANDDEFCWVEFSDRSGRYRTANYRDARTAILEAKGGNVAEF